MYPRRYPRRGMHNDPIAHRSARDGERRIDRRAVENARHGLRDHCDIPPNNRPVGRHRTVAGSDDTDPTGENLTQILERGINGHRSPP